MNTPSLPRTGFQKGRSHGFDTVIALWVIFAPRLHFLIQSLDTVVRPSYRSWPDKVALALQLPASNTAHLQSPFYALEWPQLTGFGRSPSISTRLATLRRV